jgi:hypothetical protein
MRDGLKCGACYLALDRNIAVATQGNLMSMSNLAVRMEQSATELLSDLAKPDLRVVANPAPSVERDNRPKTSLSFRKFVNRDTGFRSFRVY